jgi:lipopolysaccharide cholinephosphotransferase
MKTEHPPGSPVSASDMREIQMDILRRIDALCEKRGWHYCLCGGTLLGAIRHKGFIPWDDDIDLLMPRKDYDAFLREAPELIGNNYTVAHIGNDPSHVYPFAKIYDNNTVLTEPGNPPIGVYVDVFPMDGLPNEIGKSDRIFAWSKIFLTLIDSSRTGFARRGQWWKTCLKFPLHLICKCVGHGFFLKRLDRLARRHDFETSNFAAVLVACNYGRRERIAKSAFASFEKAPFEDGQFAIPVGWHRYLSNLYGDYMKPPPENKRGGWHAHTCVWK